MCKNEYEVKMQAMELMSAAVNDVLYTWEQEEPQSQADSWPLL